METAASIEEIKKLKQTVESINNPESLTITALPSFSELGEIQEYWGTFLKCLSEYRNYITNDFYGFKISSVTEEIAGSGRVYTQSQGEGTFISRKTS